jgi:hypothetical protein
MISLVNSSSERISCACVSEPKASIRQNYLVLMLAFGSLTHAQEMRSLELFTSEIMPKLAAMNYEEASPAPALATV